MRRPNRAESATATILHADGEDLKSFKLATGNLKGLQFASLGTFRFEANGQGFVLITNAASQGYVTVDAVQFLPAEESPDAPVVAKESKKAKGDSKQSSPVNSKSSSRNGKKAVLSARKPCRWRKTRHLKMRRSTSVAAQAISVLRASWLHPGGAASRCPSIPADASGRLHLAQWMTSRDHPLTSRVMVNRVWHWLFGAGIVRTTDNFGSTGEVPSHPELLDYLAVKFMEDGWNLKNLVKEMVMSRTYRHE
jgi:hypothetical protein